LYVNPLLVEDLKSKILFLWNNEAERIRRAEKGLEYVQKFSDENIANNMMKVYQELCSKGFNT
ncbi:MAG: glycosyltransferase family 1 protein, partial [Kaistella sp.]